MHFTETKLKGLYLVDLERREDHRGFFARAWCQHELGEQQLETQFVQANDSYNPLRGTIRGLHYQIAPYEEVKYVRCISGAVYDVSVDLRSDSPTFGQWIGVELTAHNRRMLYVPKGFAHGYLSLLDDTEVLYLVSAYYTPGAVRGLRYDDPALGITWPIPIEVVSEADKAWPGFVRHPAAAASEPEPPSGSRV